MALVLYQLFLNFSLRLPEAAGVRTVTDKLRSSQFSDVQLRSHVYSVKSARFCRNGSFLLLMFRVFFFYLVIFVLSFYCICEYDLVDKIIGIKAGQDSKRFRIPGRFICKQI